MMDYKIEKGMIISVDLNPTKGSETGKIRPCVVVTNDVYNQRVPVIQVVPITEWNEKKAFIKTNVTIEPDKINGITKKSVADCLQTRPIDYKTRIVRTIGKVDNETIKKINTAIMFVFGLE
jgi:mRNA interferase MazF